MVEDLSHGRAVHYRRHLPLHRAQLGHVRQARYRPVAAAEALRRARWRAPGCHRGVRGRKTAGIASSTEVDRLAEVIGLGTPGSACLDLFGKYCSMMTDV